MRRSIVADQKEILKYCDLYTEQVFNLPETFQVQATVSRLVIDPNRAANDIKPETNSYSTQSIPLKTLSNKPIYEGELSSEDIKNRIKHFHALYHWQLEMYLPLAKFLIDGHSMHSHAPKMFKDAGTPRPDICLGTLGGTTCPAEHTDFFRQSFEALGYNVTIDDPFTGNYIMRKYCQSNRIPGLQIELNQSLFMDEETQAPLHDKIQKVNQQLAEMVYHFCEKFYPDYIV